MTWNNTSYIDRLIKWKQLRADISSLDVVDALMQVAEFWAKVPYTNSKIDLYDTAEWGSPWDLIEKSMVCDNMISILIFYTIVMALPDLEVDMRIVHVDGENFLVVVVSDTYVLNYELGKAINIDEHKLKYVHTFVKDELNKVT